MYNAYWGIFWAKPGNLRMERGRGGLDGGGEGGRERGREPGENGGADGREGPVIRRTSQFFDCNFKLGLGSHEETAGSVARPMQTQMKTMCLLQVFFQQVS